MFIPHFVYIFINSGPFELFLLFLVILNSLLYFVQYILCKYMFSFLLNIYRCVGLLSHLVSLCFVFKVFVKLFPKKLHHFAFPSAMHEDCNFSVFSLMIIIFIVTMMLIIVSCLFWLICHLNIFSREIAIQILYHFFNWVVLLSCKYIHVLWMKVPYWIYNFQIFFSHFYGLSFHFFDGIIWSTKFLKNVMGSIYQIVLLLLLWCYN